MLAAIQLTEIRHVGDMYANVECPIVIRLDGQRIVEIFRRRRIDRKDTLGPKILTDFELALGYADCQL